MELAGRIVVVPVEWEGAAALARRLGGEGATVVLVGSDPGAAGRLAGELEAAGSGRPAVFLADGTPASLDALAGFIGELFRTS